MEPVGAEPSRLFPVVEQFVEMGQIDEKASRAYQAYQG